MMMCEKISETMVRQTENKKEKKYEMPILRRRKF